MWICMMLYNMYIPSMDMNSAIEVATGIPPNILCGVCFSDTRCIPLRDPHLSLGAHVSTGSAMAKPGSLPLAVGCLDQGMTVPLASGQNMTKPKM